MQVYCRNTRSIRSCTIALGAIKSEMQATLANLHIQVVSALCPEGKDRGCGFARGGCSCRKRSNRRGSGGWGYQATDRQTGTRKIERISDHHPVPPSRTRVFHLWILQEPEDKHQ